MSLLRSLRIAIFLGIVCSVSSFSQSGRFEEAKRRAAAYLDGGEYDRAAARLEEVWEQDQSDAAVAEGLAIAYLNGGDRKYRQGLETKAQHLLQETIRLGGMATFIVQHSHGKFAVFQGKSINDYCSGKLSIQPGRVVFIAQPRKGAQEHSFEAAAEALRITAPDENGAFQIKTRNGNYTMFPRTRIKKDSELIVSLIQENLAGR